MPARPASAGSPITPERPRRRRVAALLGLLALPLAGASPATEGSDDAPVPPHAVVLEYHHVADDTPAATSVSIERFEAHLEHLADNDYRVWPLPRIVETLRDGGDIPDKVVALTFDDAYDSVYDNAWPRLRARGWPWTLFVATEGVDRGYKALLSWDQLRELYAAPGVTIANHTHSHDHLLRRLKDEGDAAWRRRMRSEIATAQRRLADELGDTPKLLAYPYGEHNRAMMELARDMGYTAFGQHSGAIGPGSDWRALPRFPVSAGYGELEAFATKVASLPLPVAAARPEDPELSEETLRPRLTLELGNGDYRRRSLRCFATGQGAISHRLEDGRLTVRAPKPLPPGRSRYNCTARHRSLDRYYWYSHPWFRRSEGD